MEDEQKFKKVSVILPVYNGSKFLKNCISSVLNQSYPITEFIIVNDGSEDNSEAIIDEFDSVIKINIPNSGVAAARNLGIQRSSSDWICFIDQDDIWTKDSLRERILYTEHNIDADIIIGKQKWFLDGLAERPTWVKPEQMNIELDGYLLGCAMIRMILFDQCGIFDESYRFSSDFDWFFKLKDHHVIFHQVDSVVLEKRIHQKNESRHTEMLHKELSKAIFSSIKRKRSRN